MRTDILGETENRLAAQGNRMPAMRVWQVPFRHRDGDDGGKDKQGARKFGWGGQERGRGNTGEWRSGLTRRSAKLVSKDLNLI